MEQAEDEILSFCKVEVSKYFVNIQMENKPFRVRVYDCGNKNNKTLVFVQGYFASALRTIYFFDKLASNYRVIMIEHGSVGLNSKLD